MLREALFSSLTPAERRQGGLTLPRGSSEEQVVLAAEDYTEGSLSAGVPLLFCFFKWDIHSQPWIHSAGNELRGIGKL